MAVAKRVGLKIMIWTSIFVKIHVRSLLCLNYIGFANTSTRITSDKSLPLQNQTRSSHHTLHSDIFILFYNTEIPYHRKPHSLFIIVQKEKTAAVEYKNEKKLLEPPLG
jgi:hypothetical protein